MAGPRLRLALLALTVAGFLSAPAAAKADAEAARWSAIKASESANDFEAFLEEFPTGEFAREARLKYSLLAGTSLPARIKDIEIRFPPGVRQLALSIGPNRTVGLDIVVRENGKAGQIRITKRSGFDPFDNAAFGAARRAVYLPAVDHGKAVTSTIPEQIGFGFLCNRAAAISE